MPRSILPSGLRVEKAEKELDATRLDLASSWISTTIVSRR